MEEKEKENRWILRGKIFWLYVKYQIVSKALVTIGILPLFYFITDLMVKSSGRTNLTSGDYLGFLMSFQGLLVILLGILLLIFVLGVDINTFIIISSLVEEGKLEMKIKDILKMAILSLKYFFSPIGIFIVLFIAFVLPILGLGISLGPLKGFKIPNFITAVIFNQPLYYVGYIILFIFLIGISILYIFTLHFMIIDHRRMINALKSSRKLVIKHWKKFILHYLWAGVKILFICLMISLISLLIITGLSYGIGFIYENNQAAVIFIFLSMVELLSFFAFLSVPMIIYVLTKLFYQYNQMDGYPMHIKFPHSAEKLPDEEIYRKITTKTKFEIVFVFVVILLLNIEVSIYADNHFEEVFKTKVDAALIAHRGGGDLGAENTLDGIQKAIEENVDWVEIDVQRTKDHAYIINHDVSFARVSGVNKKPGELTLAEVKKLRVKNAFHPEKEDQPVATLEEIMDLSKGKIGIFIELKGESADQKMVEDVVALIKEKEMLETCVILSLDYRIIEYTEQHYPEVQTGFLYFFSFGEVKDLKGDFLIMEERKATEDHIEKVHQAGKKAIVWTVNTPKSIETFIHSDVDGIITDHIGLVKEAIEESKKRSPMDIIIDTFFAL